MNAKTSNERQATLAAKRAAAGLCQFKTWIPDTPEAKAAMKKLAAKLNKA